MSDRHQDWCDGHLDAPLVDTRHATRGTCKRCGYVGPLRERSGHLFPHKRFDRFASEPTGEDYFEAARRGFCPACSRAIFPGDFVTYDSRGIEIHYDCEDAK